MLGIRAANMAFRNKLAGLGVLFLDARPAKDLLITRSEGEAQREFHDPWFGQCIGVLEYKPIVLGLGEGAVVGQTGRVKTHGVGQVVRISAEPQGMALGDLEGLVHAGVDAEEALTTEIVALAGLSRIRKPQNTASRASPIRAGIRVAEMESEALIST
jgi:hypothetical protein